MRGLRCGPLALQLCASYVCPQRLHTCNGMPQLLLQGPYRPHDMHALPHIPARTSGALTLTTMYFQRTTMLSAGHALMHATAWPQAHDRTAPGGSIGCTL